MGDTFILWLYMLPSNTVLSVLGQQTQSSKNVTSMAFQADFLHCGEGIWWWYIMAGVEFLDGPGEKVSQDDGPPLHHFCTHTLKSEEKYLKD